MPQEFLHDVLRTGDTVERTRRRLSILPLSIAAHAIAGTLFVIMPLAAEVEVPAIRAPFDRDYIETVAPPAPPVPRSPSASPDRNLAPREAPTTITEEAATPPPTMADEEAPGTVPGIGSEARVGNVVNVAPPPAPPIVETPQPKIARPGFQGIREPKRIAYTAPEYPEIARLARVQGTVILEAVLDVTGRVHSVRVLKSIPLLDEAATRAVRQWRYTPTELNGIPVQVLMTITVNFQLSR